VSETNTHVTVARFRDVAPTDLLAKADGARLKAALIYTPDACHVASIADNVLHVVANARPTKPDLAKAYEIRAFGPDAELRWLRSGVLGDAVLIADGEVTFGDDESPTFERVETIARLPRRYRLWGKKANTATSPDGWSAVSSGRIGVLQIPEPADATGDLVIEAREYVGEDKFGNTAVMFERLVGFGPAVTHKAA